MDNQFLKYSLYFAHILAFKPTKYTCRLPCHSTLISDLEVVSNYSFLNLICRACHNPRTGILFKNKSSFFNHLCKNKIESRLFSFKKNFSPTTLGARKGLKIPIPATAEFLLFM